MAKRVGVVLSGCGARDGTDVQEAVLTLAALDRARAEVVCAAPDVEQPLVVDHLSGGSMAQVAPRRAIVEAARIARGKIRPLSELAVEDVDALVFPGGEGVATVLSSYADKGQVCEVAPDVVRLLKGLLASHRPMGFVGLAPILAARVLGPVAGVRITLGSRASAPAKHAAVMGADVRPCTSIDVFVDNKTRVVSTPGTMQEDLRPAQLATAIDKLVRVVLSLARDRNPAPPPERR